MSTVFSHIVQKRFSQVNEDVATDALAYILDGYPAIRDAFNRMLRSIEPSLPELRFRTQQTEGSIRPDMWGFDGSKPRVFVENKFWAGLTDNQPVSYLLQLAKLEQPSALLIVVPAAREQTVWRELLSRLQSSGIEQSKRAAPSGIVFSATTGSGPSISLTSWSNVLLVLEAAASGDSRAMADVLQLRSLCEEADTDAFVPFTAEEVTDQRAPARILDLGKVVQDAVQLSVTEGIVSLDGLRPQASWDWIGRYLWFGGALAGAWIGIHFPYWKQFGQTPLWLVFTPDSKFGRAAEVRKAVEASSARSELFSVADGDHFLVGIKVTTGEDKAVLVRNIADILRTIKTALSMLSPTATPAEPANE